MCIYGAAAAAAFSQVPPLPAPHFSASESTARLVQTDAAGRLELWRTKLGDLWIPAPGRHVIAHLEWEQSEQKVYEHAAARVRAGDVVVDCGAHIGAFTRVALRAGARMVVAIEPEPSNIAAFRRNFDKELRSGAVRLIGKGLWHERGKLPLRLSGDNDSHTLLAKSGAPAGPSVELLPLDELVKDLKLERVDFIKMDIEGAEVNALRGARRILRQWRPRLAISAYHLEGDPGNIASLVWEVRTDYHVGSKDVIRVPHGVVPKVLFFY
jgi:FkbM family methyltransferase